MSRAENSLGKLTKARQAYEWKLRSLDPLRHEAASLYNGICRTRLPSVKDSFATFKNALKAVADGSQQESAAFAEALERLPGMIGRIEALPKSDMKELRKMQEFEVKALNAFVEACRLGILQVRIRKLTPLLDSQEPDEVIASKVGSSRDWVKQARKWAKDCKPLEAAMFMKFVQAYKGWKLVDKAESSFWKKTGFQS